VTASDVARDGSDPCVAAYEELRSRVLMGSARASHFGLVLFLREGTTAWMDRRLACSAVADRAADPDRSATAPLVSEELHAGIVRVLASMAMAGRGEIGT
jgi:hypothetical protein